MCTWKQATGGKEHLGVSNCRKNLPEIQVCLPIVVWSHPRNDPQTIRVEKPSVSTYGRAHGNPHRAVTLHLNIRTITWVIFTLGKCKQLQEFQPKTLGSFRFGNQGSWVIYVYSRYTFIYIYIQYILPTQTMHCYKGNTQNYHRFVLFGSPKNGSCNDACETRSYLKTSQEFAYPPRN